MGHVVAMDLFSGMGSASIGLQRANIEVVAALDVDGNASFNYELNVGFAPIVGDIRRITGKALLDHAGVSRGDVDIVVGCPPCQGFSSLTRTRETGRDHDPRNLLLSVFADRISEIRPSAVIFENVGGLAHPRFRRRLSGFLSKLSTLDYCAEWSLVNCADYGIPQIRKRVIVIAVLRDHLRHRVGLIPNPTHAAPSVAHERRLPTWRTVWHAIGDLPPLRSGETDSFILNHDVPRYRAETMRIISSIPKNGGDRRSLPRHLWLKCHKDLEKGGVGGAASVYGRLSWVKPAPTITTRCTNPSSGRFIHPQQNRGMSLREAMRMQSIPDGCYLKGSRGKLSIQVGNAVPTRLMELIGNHVSSLLA